MITAKIAYCDGTHEVIALDAPLLSKDRIRKPAEYVDLLLDDAIAREGEEGYFLRHNRLTHFSGHSEETQDTGYCEMHFFGVKTPRACFAAVIDGLYPQAHIMIEKQNDIYRIWPRFLIEGADVPEDMSLVLYPLSGEDANYSGMARAYRAHQIARGKIVPIRKRANEHLSYMLDAPEIRIRMGWKPVPSPIGEQTIETEPQMHVAMTFEQVGELMDACRAQGVDKAEFCLVGWNKSGHDGRWPQAFPVEDQLGGEEALRKLAQKARDMGYKLVCHTNATDGYSIADTWHSELPMRGRDGSPIKGGNWGGGTMYNLCPKSGAVELACRVIDGVKELGFSGIHYVDVISTIAPRRCFSEKHPCTQAEFIEAMHKVARYSKEQIGGFQSEGGYDYMAENLDMALYLDFSLFDRRNFYDDNVPAWQIVYHDAILSNPGTNTVNYPVKPAEMRLKCIEYGAHPFLYVYSKFKSDGSSWMGLDDLVCDTPEQTQATARAIRSALDDYRALGDTRAQAIVAHERRGELSITTYESGARIVCNYADAPAEFEGKMIGAMDYILI